MNRNRLMKLLHTGTLSLSLGSMLLASLGSPVVASPGHDIPGSKESQQTGTATASTPRLRLRIAVDQGKVNEIGSDSYRLPPETGAGIQALLMDKLQKSGYFQVMERESTAIEAMKNEDQTEKQKKGEQPPDKPTNVPSRQQRTPAQYIITPTVVEFKVEERTFGVKIGPIDTRGIEQTAKFQLNIRISDSQISKVLDTCTTEGNEKTKSKGIKGSVAGVNFGSNEFKQMAVGKALEQALDQAVAKITERLAKQPWSALVAAQDSVTGRVIVNAGTAAGLEAGMEFDVFKAGIGIPDPETGDLLTHGDEVKTGRVRVVRVERNVAFCDVVDGKSFAVKDVIRPVR